MSQKDRERLQNIAVSTSAPTTASASNPPPEPTITIPRTEPHVAQAALRGFQPFTSDPAKQARYIAYLHSQASPDSFQPPLQPNSGQKIYEFNKELADYATAALIFKPVSGAMAGRFTSATVVDRGPKLHEGLHVPSAEDQSRESSPSSNKPAEIEETNPKAHAARMGLYGLLTREVKPWQPAGLLCKRFGVKDPTPKTESESAASAPAPATASGSWIPDPVEASPYAKDHTLASGSGSAKRNGPRDLENIGLGEDDDQGRDILSYQRPAMEIFKAIFASDEEDSSDDEARESRPIDGGTGTVDDPRLATTSSIPRLLHEPVSSASVPSGPLVASVQSESTEKADHASFRPTFIPRSDKPKRTKERDKKDKRKTSSRLSLVSFELDEDGGESASRNVKPRKRRRNPKHEHGSDGDEGMWVEKPPPGALKDLQIGAPASLHNEASPGGGETLKGRKRAIDFM
jgi:G patch domain-containing protein 1